MLTTIRTIFLTLLITFCESDFITTKGTTLIRDSKPYYFLGTNFWYGMNLAAEDPARLKRELEALKDLGINNLRIMGSSQGPNTEPFRMADAIEVDGNGTVNETILQGLDLLLAEMKRLDMVAVVPLNNFWHWSGGFSQYVYWYCKDVPIPYPAPGWGRIVEYAKQFYTCENATAHYLDYFEKLANRVNTKTNITYKDDPTIMAWQLANEPWPVDLGEKYTNWVNNTIRFIKKVDRNHLVSIGIEGLISDRNYERNGNLSDYLTCHVWAQGWNWYNPRDTRTFDHGKKAAKDYIENHMPIVQRLNKPFVLEEFGLTRDNVNYSVSATTIYKDLFYEHIFEVMYNLSSQKLASGSNFWAWAGEGRPNKPGGYWTKGDSWTGDPPADPQGANSVYDNDTTVPIIRKYANLFNALKQPARSYLGLIITGTIGLLIALMTIVVHFKFIKPKETIKQNA